jgi:hypothetical protein
MTDTFIKDPNAVLDYQWDWSLWLHAAETISSVTVTPAPGIVVDSHSNTNSTVTVWLSGGTDGNGYSVVCSITTNQGRTDDRTIYIVCQSR